MGFVGEHAAHSAEGSQSVSDLLDRTETWQLVGLTLCCSVSLPLSSVLLHSSLPADDAGRLAAWLAGGLVTLRLCCGRCAWSPYRQKCIDVW